MDKFFNEKAHSRCMDFIYVYIYAAIYCCQETDFNFKDTHRLYMKEQKDIPCRGNQKKTAVPTVPILTSDKTDLISNTATKDNKDHYIMMNDSVHQKNGTIVNIYSPNIGMPTFIKEIPRDLKGEVYSNGIMVGDFNFNFVHFQHWIDYPDRISIWELWT